MSAIPITDRFVVVIRGEVRCRFPDAWAAECEAARLRSFGFPAHTVDQFAEWQDKRERWNAWRRP